MAAKRSEPSDPKARAVKLLSRREHSARELKRKLEQRGISGEDAEAAVADLNKAGWQSDERYAEMLVRSRVNQGYGPVRIEAELTQAGVDDEKIRDALRNAGADWTALAIEAQRRHFAALPKSSAERAKQYRYLAGRGFDSSHISSALKGGPEEL